MFVRRKTYKEMKQSRDQWKDLAQRTMAQNEETILINEHLIEERKNYQQAQNDIYKSLIKSAFNDIGKLCDKLLNNEIDSNKFLAEYTELQKGYVGE